jgi:oligopeptidase A
MTNSGFPAGHLPRFSDIKPETIVPALKSQLQTNRETLKKLLSQSGPITWESLMQPLEDMSDELNKFWSPVGHLHAVMETEPLREVYNEALQLLTEYHTELSQNEALFHAIESLATNADYASLSAAQKKIIENDIRDFKLAGVHLSPEKKLQFAALQLEHSKLTTTFSENLLDATQSFILHITDVNELDGLPAQSIQLAKEHAELRKLDGYVITLDYPSYSTAMKFLHHRESRKKLYEAHTTRASDQGPDAGKWDNSAIMDKIMKIRHDMAQLIGFNNFAEYSLATKMAKSPQEVLNFLNDLLHRSKSIAEVEYQDIRDFAAKEGVDKLEVWDVAYYSEKYRVAHYDFSQEDLRAYFPIQTVLNGMFNLVQKLYGITIREDKNVDIWHPQVQFFSIYDTNNELRAGFYIDLYARAHKRDGAWMDDCRVRRRTSQGIQIPVAYLTCNFMPPVENQPALLTHDDVVTLFHEFGHCLHHMLTKVDYASVAGINGVPWDAVEFPSQFMENYCWEKASLDLIAKHYQTNEPLPATLYDKMMRAKHFQTGLQMIRQIEFALFDFRIHLEYSADKANFIQSTLDEVRKEAAIVQPPRFNRFQHSFSHIFAGGYAAGYYSYKWAEVLSSDAYAQFEENGIFDYQTGRSFMENILEIGGVRDPMASFVAFRGRKPTIDALLRHSGIPVDSVSAK